MVNLREVRAVLIGYVFQHKTPVKTAPTGVGVTYLQALKKPNRCLRATQMPLHTVLQLAYRFSTLAKRTFQPRIEPKLGCFSQKLMVLCPEKVGISVKNQEIYGWNLWTVMLPGFRVRFSTGTWLPDLSKRRLVYPLPKTPTAEVP